MASSMCLISHIRWLHWPRVGQTSLSPSLDSHSPGHFSLHTSPTSKVVGLLYMMAKKKKDKLDGLLGLGCELAKYHLQHILLVNQITGAAKIQGEGTWILPLCERSSIPSQGWGEFLAALFAQYSSLFVKKQTHILHSLVKQSWVNY